MPRRPEAIVILGCRPWQGQARGALARRLARGAEAYRVGIAERVVVAGGKRWGGVPEAQVMSGELTRLGVPERAIIEERYSRSTRENALCCALILERLTHSSLELAVRPSSAPGALSIALVTCDFHMARASSLFRRSGLQVTELPAISSLSRAGRLRLQLSEAIKVRLDALAAGGGAP